MPKVGQCPYFDVEMPSGASDIIRQHLEWSTPVSLVPQIQTSFPNVTAKQVHAAWTDMSETSDDVDVFDITVADGVEQLCWGMKKVANRLKGKVVEIGVDATCA